MEERVVTYSWTKGWLYFTIERNWFPSGRREVICKISRYKKSAQHMAIIMTRALADNLEIQQSLEKP